MKIHHRDKTPINPRDNYALAWFSSNGAWMIATFKNPQQRIEFADRLETIENSDLVVAITFDLNVMLGEVTA